MGRAITEGMVPYKDYFDLKGPVFFFIEAIGQFFIHGRMGIFLIECIAASVSSVFIWKICRLYIEPYHAAIVLLLTAFVAVSPFWGGNTCEEFMLPFNFACIYLTLKYLKLEKYEEYFVPAFVFGISFSVMLLSKITTCAPMAAAAFTVVIVLIMKRQHRYLPFIIGYFLLGFLVIFIPVCVYFILHDAFRDFIYAAFIFAYKRGTDYYETFSWEWESKLIICYTGFVAALIIPTRKSGEHYLRIFGILLSFLTWAALHLGTPYDYYFLLTMPVFIYTVMSTFAHWKNRATLMSVLRHRLEYEGSVAEAAEPVNAGTNDTGPDDNDNDTEHGQVIRDRSETVGYDPSEAAAQDPSEAAAQDPSDNAAHDPSDNAGHDKYENVGAGTARYEFRSSDSISYERGEGFEPPDMSDFKNYFMEGEITKLKRVMERPDRKRIVRQRRILWVILIFIVVAHYYPSTMFKVRENLSLAQRSEDQYVEECKGVLDVVPESEWDNIYDLESGMIFYEVNQLLPANRYPVNLPYFLHLNPQIKANVLQYLDVVKPKYVMSEEMAAFDDEDTRNYVFGHYVMLCDIGAEEIYVRTE